MDHRLENSSLACFELLKEYTKFYIMRTLYSIQKAYMAKNNNSIMNIEYKHSKTCANSKLLFGIM